ncbi:hypothetical protein [Tenacibaculum xiamenense]|uniref:hypothetical protein n=1 Tax=Tenacibaculum xiamenense TaxID=1261553 RepID=UPI003893C9BA
MSKKGYKNKFKNSEFISGKVKKKESLISDLDNKIKEEIEKQKEIIDEEKKSFSVYPKILFLDNSEPLDLRLT